MPRRIRSTRRGKDHASKRHRSMAIRIANDLVRELSAVGTRTCVGWIDAAEQVMVRARREYVVKQERYDRDAAARLRWPPRTIFDPGPPPALPDS